ncbi:HAD family hydrolase [Chloroflexi bacterium]|nr:HAD family hydrolase [Chloroflexota bacterium]
MIQKDNPSIIIFDCFETIVENDRSSWIDLFSTLVKDNNWNINPNNLWKIWKKEEVLFREIRTNLNDLTLNPDFKTYEQAWSNCFEKVLDELNLKGNPKDLSKKCIINMGKNKPYEESSVYLNKMSEHCKLGVISNADNDFLNPVLKKIDFKFDYILSSESARLYKPDPRIFLRFLEENKLDPEDCWYVGDKEYDDVLGSSSVGMKPFLIDRSVYNEIEVKNKFIKISNLIQLYEILKK